MAKRKKPERPPPKCKACGTEIPRPPGKRGRDPTYCPAHATRQNRKARIQSVARHEGTNAARAAAAAAGLDYSPEDAELLGRRSAIALKATELELLAVGLGRGGSVQEAARRVGIEGYSGPELEQLAERARELYPELVEGSVEGLSRIAKEATLLGVLNLRARIPSAPVGQLGAILKQLAQVQEMLSGGLDPVFGDFVLEFPGIDPQHAADVEDLVAELGEAAS